MIFITPDGMVWMKDSLQDCIHVDPPSETPSPFHLCKPMELWGMLKCLAHRHTSWTIWQATLTRFVAGFHGNRATTDQRLKGIFTRISGHRSSWVYLRVVVEIIPADQFTWNLTSTFQFVEKIGCWRRRRFERDFALKVMITKIS